VAGDGFWLLLVESRELRPGIAISSYKLIEFSMEGERIAATRTLNKQCHHPNDHGRNGVEIEGVTVKNDPSPSL
jgi:hypothetical protein